MSRRRCLARWTVTAAAAALTTCGTAVPRAEACSCGGLPARFQHHGKVPLPADARGLLHAGTSPWIVDPGTGSRPSWDPVPTADDYSIETLDGGVIPHAIEVLREPAIWGDGGVMATGVIVYATKPLAPGKYRFKRPGGQMVKHTFKGGKEMFLNDGVNVVEVGKTGVDPKAQIVLKVSAEKRAKLKVAAGLSCSAEVDAAQRVIEVVLPEAMKPLAPNLLFETTVDGKAWRPADSICSRVVPGDSWRGKGKELVYAMCEPKPVLVEEGLAPNVEHWVQVRVRAPGSKTVLETAREKFTLHCPPPVEEVTKPPPKAAPRVKARGCNGCTAGDDASSEPSWEVLLATLFVFGRRRRQVGRRVPCVIT